MNNHHKINYIEIPVKDVAASKQFFSQVFAWQFVDYGEDYAVMVDAGIAGGLFKSSSSVSTAQGSVLVVIYSVDLAASQIAIEQAGGKIIKPIFSFPGGRRFHFSDINNNEYALWSDK
ncbi:MAG: putative enzyme related to lactoylglutathione lyase [Paraglaciecola sp.]|jgi:predicted enzyme related to lactoylglutathione lyase